jgi:hypothetical protein
MHLAVFNIARLRAPMDDPLIDDFRNNLDPINALAESSPGFVWRLQDESGNATKHHALPRPACDHEHGSVDVGRRAR